MVGSIDPGRETLRAIQWHADASALFGTLAAETILASGLIAAPNRPDTWKQAIAPKNLRPGLASKGPSTHGLLRRFAPRNDGDGARQVNTMGRWHDTYKLKP